MANIFSFCIVKNFNEIIASYLTTFLAMMSLTEVMATSKLSRSVAALMNALALAEA